MTPSGSLIYGSIPGIGPIPEDLFVIGLDRWVSVPSVKEIVGCLMSSAGGIAFQSLVDAMSSVRKKMTCLCPSVEYCSPIHCK